MAYKVQLLPTNREFEIQGRETILRAGMRDGVNLAHSCLNGSCGECLARLVSGEIKQSRHHDFKLSEQQKQQGWFLPCCNLAESDLVIEMHELVNASEIQVQRIEAKVAKLEQLRDDVMQLHVRLSRSQVLDFLAGQRARLCLEDDNCLELGIASCPCDGLNLRFHVRHREDAFSQQVFSMLQKGRKVVLSGPTGSFTLDESSRRPLLFIAWETGFAQINSLIDHALSIDPERHIVLYWLSALPDGHYLSNQCRAWRDALDHFSYVCVQQQPAGDATFVSSLQQLAADIELEQYDIYAVLAGQQADTLVDFMVEQEVLKDRLFIELLPASAD